MPGAAEPRLIPAGRARAEIRVVNSRFIASAGLAASVPEARAFIAAVRAEMPDASHHVYAYVIGHGATTTLGMSDDGEPSGTSGRPTLAVLQGSGLGDAVLVVTRYFGGTLLGTGGLVHAYSDAARAVLSVLPREEKIVRCALTAVVPYASYELARRLALAHQAAVVGEEFGADVTLRLSLPAAEADALERELLEATAGAVLVERGEVA
jgi:uncharacterized YigZ family protein